MKRAARHRLWGLAGLAVVLLALGLAWHWGPLARLLDIPQAARWMREVGETLGPLGVCVVVAVASVLAVPLTFLIAVSVLALGPVAGALWALAGASAGSAVSFLIGHALGREVLRQFGGPRVIQISEAFARRGVLAAVMMRLVPVAPFAIVNMVAGCSHIRLRDFLIGSLVGMLPLAVFMAGFANVLLGAVTTS